MYGRAGAIGSTRLRGYGYEHEKKRAALEPIVLAGGVACARCGQAILPHQAWDLDHSPDRTAYLGPSHVWCNRGAHRKARLEVAEPVARPAAAEPAGLVASDPRWRVPWLKGLRRPPRDATWPRLMTVPHPRAVGSLGPVFVEWAEAREGQPLRWWQRLVATRLLEVDSDGRLVWDALILSMARQLGKSWLLRELLLWRIHQGDRFGERQDVLHTGKDIAICKEVQRSARIWCRQQPRSYKVTEVNGQEAIEWLGDRSRWMIRARGAVYGYSVSLGAVDEGWKVDEQVVSEGLAPTMVERAQPQLLLVSTAHRLATSLMLDRRRAALAELETGEGDLLIEWSAPRGAKVADRAGWRQASPHWTPQREKLVAQQLASAMSGSLLDADEPDAIEGFRSQWLNQWPLQQAVNLDGEELLPPGVWASLAGDVDTGGLMWLAVEDNWGKGAAVAAVSLQPDGRLEVDGWTHDDWDSAIEWVDHLAGYWNVTQILVGANLMSRVPQDMLPTPEPSGIKETRVGLPLFRDLAANGVIVHNQPNPALTQAVDEARVREGINGMTLIPDYGHPHLVKALVWAVNAAHQPAAAPAIY